MASLVDQRVLFGRAYPLYKEEQLLISLDSIDGDYVYGELSEVPGETPYVSDDLIISSTYVPNVSTTLKRVTDRTPSDNEYRIEPDTQRVFMLKKYKGFSYFAKYYGMGNTVTAQDINSTSATPGGDNTSIQYNDNGQFNGSPNLLYENGSGVLTTPKVKITENAAVNRWMNCTDGDGNGLWATIGHNGGLTGYQGGSTSERYHLFQTDYDAITDPNSQLGDLHTDGSPTFSNLNIVDSQPQIQVLSSDVNGTRLDIDVDDSTQLITLSADMTSVIPSQPVIRIGVDLDNSNPESRSITLNGDGFVGICGEPTTRNVVTVYDDPENVNNTIFQIVADDAAPWHFSIRNISYSGSTSPPHTFRILLDDTGNTRVYGADNGVSPGDISFLTDNVERLNVDSGGVISISKSLNVSEYIQISEQSTPSTPTSSSRIFVDSVDGATKVIGSSGTITTIAPA